MLMVLCAGNKMYAQTETVKLNLLSAVYNTFNISYQRETKPDQAFQIGFSYMDFNDFSRFEEYFNYTNKVKGIALTFDYKYSISNDPFLNAFYIGGFGRFMTYKKDAEIWDGYMYWSQTPVVLNRIKEEGTFTSIGGGLIIGKNIQVYKMISLDMFVGPSYQFLITNNRSARNVTTNQDAKLENEYLARNIPNFYLTGLGLRAGVNVGFSF